MTALATLIMLMILLRQRYTSRARYRERIGQPAKMDEMRDEQWDAIKDASALPGDDHNGQEQS